MPVDLFQFVLDGSFTEGIAKVSNSGALPIWVSDSESVHGPCVLLADMVYRESISSELAGQMNGLFAHHFPNTPARRVHLHDWCRVLIRQGNAIDSDPVHESPESLIVVDRLVPRGPVVPHGDIPCLPAHTALELGLFAMLIEHFQNCSGLALSDALQYAS